MNRTRQPDFRSWASPRDRSYRWGLLGPAFVALGIVLVLFLFSRKLAERAGSVVVYVAQDQVYAEPILLDFERQTDIRVRAVYDSEAVKTVGLANRLLAERSFPQCDVFWGNEELRTRQLAAADVYRATNGWAAIGHRTRRIVIHTNHVALADAPRSLADLTNATWRGKVALAYPLFGTTATHFLALRAHWGQARWETWCRALQANQPLIVDGNSVVVRLVGKGEAWIGLTDSDDIAAGQREGYPIAALPLTSESLRIPNTVGVVRGASHPKAAQQLFEYLQLPGIVQGLVAVHALESVSPDTPGVPTLEPDWERVLRELDSATAQLRELFLR